MSEEYISITKQEFDDIVDLLQYWTTSYREGCSEKERLWLQRIIESADTIRSHPERETGHSCEPGDNSPDHLHCFGSGGNFKGTNAPGAEMLDHSLLEVMRGAWKRGYQDGCITSIADLNIVKCHAARVERERVFDKVMGTISNLNLPCNMNPYDTVACIRGEIESLRGEP